MSSSSLYSLSPSSTSLSTQRKQSFFQTPSPPIARFPNPKPSHFKTLTHISPIRSSASSATLNGSETFSTPKSLKSRLKNGETLYGLFLLSFSPTIAEIAGLAGYDYVVVDMEHGHGGVSDALPCLHALAASGTAAILRLPESCPTWTKKALDLGPQGIMFPMIDNPKLAKKAVSYCRFPPKGIRGSAHTIVRASDYGIDAGYLSNYEDDLLIMCQVESEEGASKIEDIAAVEGVDCIQMGPLDLSASMGYLWDPGHKKVKEVLRKAEKAVLGGGKAYLGGFAMPHDRPEAIKGRGYHMVSGATDLGMFRTAAVEDVNRFKISLKEDNADDDDDDKKYWSE